MSDPVEDTRALDGNPVGRVFTQLIILLSFAAISISMVMTVGDILVRLAASIAEALSGQRPKWGLFGLVDLTQLAMMSAVPLAIAVAFFLNAHIRIDLIYNVMTRNGRRWSAALTALIGGAVCGLCLWTAWGEMRGQLDFTTTSATLGIPYTWYWTPLILGFALSLLACVLGLLQAFRRDPPVEPDLLIEIAPNNE